MDPGISLIPPPWLFPFEKPPLCGDVLQQKSIQKNNWNLHLEKQFKNIMEMKKCIESEIVWEKCFSWTQLHCYMGNAKGEELLMHTRMADTDLKATNNPDSWNIRLWFVISLDHVWFLENTNERNKMLRKMIFSCLVLPWKIWKKINYN